MISKVLNYDERLIHDRMEKEKTERKPNKFIQFIFRFFIYLFFAFLIYGMVYLVVYINEATPK
jgi:cell division septal protein FtsQ